jgi:hypothetical protein
MSFPWVSTRLVPRTDPCKLAVLLAAVAVAGCGGGSGEHARLVAGTGYTFSAPATWQIVRTARQTQVVEGGRSLSLVAVSRFPLRRAADEELSDDVVGDLDAAADQIVRQQGGSLTDSATETIADRQGRRYKIAYDLHGTKVVETLAFVLRGKTEFLLLCRYAQSASSDPCELLLSSFKLV